MEIHICPLDRWCRQFDPPWRLNIATKRWFLGIALTPGARYCRMVDGKLIPEWIDFRRIDHEDW